MVLSDRSHFSEASDVGRQMEGKWLASSRHQQGILLFPAQGSEDTEESASLWENCSDINFLQGQQGSTWGLREDKGTEVIFAESGERHREERVDLSRTESDSSHPNCMG